MRLPKVRLVKTVGFSIRKMYYLLTCWIILFVALKVWMYLPQQNCKIFSLQYMKAFFKHYIFLVCNWILKYLYDNLDKPRIFQVLNLWNSNFETCPLHKFSQQKCNFERNQNCKQEKMKSITWGLLHIWSKTFPKLR